MSDTSSQGAICPRCHRIREVPLVQVTHPNGGVAAHWKCNHCGHEWDTSFETGGSDK